MIEHCNYIYRLYIWCCSSRSTTRWRNVYWVGQKKDFTKSSVNMNDTCEQFKIRIAAASGITSRPLVGKVSSGIIMETSIFEKRPFVDRSVMNTQWRRPTTQH